MPLLTPLKEHPRLFDLGRKLKRRLRPGRDAVGAFFDAFSRARPEGVRFIQIGASDGLRNDPIREFVVRDRWHGLFVEPLPDVFGKLEANYRYLRNPDLAFVNAAIVPEAADDLTFWTFKAEFLAGLPVEKRMEYLRKASFDLEQVRRHLPSTAKTEDVLQGIRVRCLTLSTLWERHWRHGPLDLIVIDAEGYDAAIIRAIDIERMSPKAIFFEAQHMPEKEEIIRLLEGKGYALTHFGRDSVALR